MCVCVLCRVLDSLSSSELLFLHLLIINILHRAQYVKCVSVCVCVCAQWRVVFCVVWALVQMRSMTSVVVLVFDHFVGTDWRRAALWITLCPFPAESLLCCVTRSGRWLLWWGQTALFSLMLNNWFRARLEAMSDKDQTSEAIRISSCFLATYKHLHQMIYFWLWPYLFYIFYIYII